MTMTDTVAPAGRRTRWPDRMAPLTAAWGLISAVVALGWTLTERGYPFGAADPAGHAHLLREVPAAVGAPLLACLAAAALLGGVLLAGPARPHPALGRTLAAVGWLIVGVLLVVVPDVRLLALAGYLPMLIVGLPLGWPDVDYSTVFTVALATQVWSVAGGALLARALLVGRRRAADRCVCCGRGPAPERWATPAAVGRCGRWAVGVAVVVPVLYALTRFAWLVGIPLGMSDAQLAEAHRSGGVWVGAGLGAFAVVGAVLTLGLVQRWGEVFPRWMVGLAGRRVPIALAVVPATLVAVLVMSAALSVLAVGAPAMMGSAAGAPMLLWPFWSVALAVAALTYQRRRRGPCAVCRRA